jgi:hypothetical protein
VPIATLSVRWAYQRDEAGNYSIPFHRYVLQTRSSGTIGSYECTFSGVDQPPARHVDFGFTIAMRTTQTGRSDDRGSESEGNGEVSAEPFGVGVSLGGGETSSESTSEDHTVLHTASIARFYTIGRQGCQLRPHMNVDLPDPWTVDFVRLRPMLYVPVVVYINNEHRELLSERWIQDGELAEGAGAQRQRPTPAAFYSRQRGAGRQAASGAPPRGR